MNREIKFRAKGHTDDQWLYGNLATDRTGLYVILPTEDWSKGDTVFEETIGQFTGLYDRNQNAIYEDDILQLTNNGVKLYSVVKWNEELGAWCIMLEGDLKEGSRPLGKWLCDRDYKIEVIGNIFDNKELLNQQ